MFVLATRIFAYKTTSFNTNLLILVAPVISTMLLLLSLLFVIVVVFWLVVVVAVIDDTPVVGVTSTYPNQYILYCLPKNRQSADVWIPLILDL
jgi:hypothetical protein